MGQPVLIKERGILGKHGRGSLSQAGVSFCVQLIERQADAATVLHLCLQHSQNIAPNPILMVHKLNHDRGKAEQGDCQCGHDRTSSRTPLHVLRTVSELALLIQTLSSHHPLHGIAPCDQSRQHNSGKENLPDDVSQYGHLLIFHRITADSREAEIFYLNRETNILLPAGMQREVFFSQVLLRDPQLP